MNDIRAAVPLAPLTTFQIGGNAQFFAEVRSEEEIDAALSYARANDLPFTVLAGGSNVLIPDDGLKGLVIRITDGEYVFNDTELTAFAGCNLLELIREAAHRGLGGWEKLSGIPGSIGGAVRGNAGAFGPEIKDFVTDVRAMDTGTGQVRDFSAKQCEFSYRHSYFKDHPEWIILRVHIKLAQAEPAKITESIEATILDREQRHLQNVRAAGSFFMNPPAPPEIVAVFEREKNVQSRGGRVPAGWLIEKAGMKGATVGGAIASLQHPNYIVNNGNATAADVRELAERIRDKVATMFSIRLEEEAMVF